jgi:DNA adenine methylase
LKWHGGKNYLARRFIALMPPHLHYVEPFAGELAVLLAKDPEGVSEVINDLDGQLINFWRVLRDEAAFERLRRQVETTPFSRQEWEGAHARRPTGDAVLDAVAFFVECRQSLAGRRDSFAPLSRTRTRRAMNEQASAWIGAVDGLPAVHARLRRVVIENQDALELISGQDGLQTFFYLDPPYCAETRTAPDVYSFEMGQEHHERLLEVLAGIKGKFLLSGYASPLYDDFARRHGWDSLSFDLANNAAGGANKRRMVEMVWANYELKKKEEACNLD